MCWSPVFSHMQINSPGNRESLLFLLFLRFNLSLFFFSLQVVKNQQKITLHNKNQDKKTIFAPSNENQTKAWLKTRKQKICANLKEIRWKKIRAPCARKNKSHSHAYVINGRFFYGVCMSAHVSVCLSFVRTFFFGRISSRSIIIGVSRIGTKWNVQIKTALILRFVKTSNNKRATVSKRHAYQSCVIYHNSAMQHIPVAQH